MPLNPPLQAENSCNFDQFTDIIKQLLDATWGPKWGTFSEAFPSGTDAKDVTMPVITYSLKKMSPGVINKAGNVELKARHRGTHVITEEGVDPLVVDVYGRVLDCDVTFDIWETNNTKVNQLAMRFMEFMDMYLGYFKGQGVKEVIWKEFDSEIEVDWRDDVVGRRLSYHVRLEHVFEVQTDTIKKVTGLVSTMNESDDYKNESIPLNLGE